MVDDHKSSTVWQQPEDQDPRHTDTIAVNCCPKCRNLVLSEYCTNLCFSGYKKAINKYPACKFSVQISIEAQI